MDDIGPIILPPAPPNVSTNSPAAIQQATAQWTRAAEQAIRKLQAYVNLLNKNSGGGGSGIPVGGTTGQVLEKNSNTDGDAGWYTTHYIPVGGATGTFLGKNSSTDYDVSWNVVHQPPVGGSTNFVLTKLSGTDYDYGWVASPAGLISGGTAGQALIKNSSTDFDVLWQTLVPTGGTAGQTLVKNSSTNYDESWSSDPTVRSIVLCSGFTPQLIGGDFTEIEVPFAADGTTSLTWNVKRIFVRVGTAGGAPSVTIEKSTGTGGFSASTVGTVTLGSGANEGSVTTGLGTLVSGNKLRFNVVTLATAQNWTIIVELAQ